MLTLFEASKLFTDDMFRAGIIEMFAKSSDILNAMSFLQVDGNAYSYNLEGDLPGVAFRGIGGSYTSSAGIVNPQTERLRVGGGELDVDLVTLKSTDPGARVRHELMKVKALSLSIGATVINGNSATNPLEFDGLRNRISGSQLFYAGTTDGGDPLSLVTLRDLIDTVDGATHLIMNKRMRNLLTAAASDINVGGFISHELDQFGRRVTFFDNLPILIADYDNLNAQVIDFNEVGFTGATATAASIYCVKMGGDGVTGLQNGIMEVRDLGELETKPSVRTRIEWMVGMAVQHGRAAARLGGISNAAVTK